jgi:WD40 repeat protein
MSESIVAAPPSPYKGLAPFEDSALDALLFFGREREIEVIVANLMAARLTVLYGASGVGKTSLLRAGVAHRLRRAHGAIVVVFSSWTGNPVAELLDAVEHAADANEPMRRTGSLADVLAAWTRRLDSDLYIVLDQFDEYFLYHEGESGPGTLADELPEALRRGGLRANFLLGIREDSLARLDAFKARIPNLFANSLRLDRLDRIAARAAIVGPLERYNEFVPADLQVSAEPELVEAVLDEVAVGRVDLGQSGRGGLEGREDRDRVEAPYLQLVLERLWQVETAQGSRRLHLETLEGLGGAANIVQDHLERAMSELSPDEKDAAAAIYNHLVTPSGTKIAHRAGDLAGYASVDEAETERVLGRLVEERIVRAGENGAEGPRYEIFHDVLAEAVLAWRARHEAERLLQTERRAAARRHRRMLVFAVAAAILITILAAIAIFALAQRHDARNQARRARGRELAARASTAAATDPERAVQLALAATKYERSRPIEEVLRNTLRGLRVKAVLPVPRGAVADVDFSFDGRRLVTAGGDGAARIYRASDGRRVLVLGHGRPLTAAVFSPDDKKVATGGKDGRVRIWNAKTGVLLRTLRHDGPVTSVTFSHDGRLLATASEDKTARLWDVATGALLHTLEHPAAVRSASFDHDGTMVVTALVPTAGDSTARVFDVSSGSEIWPLTSEHTITSARFSPSGHLVVTASVDGTASVWDARYGVRIQQLRGHEGRVLDAEFSPSAQQIVTSGTDDTARVVTTRTGALVGVLTNHHLSVLRSVFSPDGETVATASSDRIARIFLPNGTLRATLLGHRDSVVDVAFSTDGESVATASLDGTARLWDRRPQPDLLFVGRQRTKFAPVAVEAVAFGGGGDRIVSVGKDGSVRVWRLGRPRPPVRSFRLGSAAGPVALSGDGRRAAGATAGGTVRIWDVGTQRLVQTLRGTGFPRSLSFSSDARRLTVVTRRGTVRIWDIASARPGRVIRSQNVVAASLSPDGRRVVTAGADTVAQVWDARTGAAVGGPFVGHTKPLTYAGFSPNGRYVVTTSQDHDARVWNTSTGKLVWTLRGHAEVVSSAAFSADGRWVVTAGPGSAGVWDMSTGRPLFFLNGHDRPLIAAAFSPHGWRIATGGRHGTVKTYDCLLCGNVDDLIAVARARLANLHH